jgi:hypothetical protein
MANKGGQRALITGTALSICFISLIWSALPVSGDSAQTVSENQSSARFLAQDKKQKELDRKRESFKSGRELLLKRGVPFDPDVLLQGDWQAKLAPAFAAMPEFQEIREGTERMEGVHFADTLILPEYIELTGDTVMIAREFVFLGKKVTIKGPHSLTLFPTQPILGLDADLVRDARKGSPGFIKAGFSTPRLVATARARGLLVQPASININLNGLGRDEWLQKQKAGLRNKSYNNHTKRSNSGSLSVQNYDKNPGETGGIGNTGNAAVTPPVQAQGPPGHCALSTPDGFTGDQGDNATNAGTGGIGLRGIDGDGGATFTGSFSGTQTFNISVRGGRGGQGGPGGPGGYPAQGGKGGRGGPGAECPCSQNSGNGGPGGRGGKGSFGGLGGKGGQGAFGGSGGTINLTLTCYTGSYVTDVGGGAAGPQGAPGPNSDGGAPGDGGDRGEGKKNISCLSLGGNDGPPGQAGLPGDNNLTVAQPGDQDGPGPNGHVYPTAVACSGPSQGTCGGSATWSSSSGCLPGFIAVGGICTRSFSFQQQCDPAVDPYSEEQCECVPLYQSPILIDVLGDGFALTDAANGVDFNFSGHQLLHSAWTAPYSDEAFLILDRNSNGTVDNGGELFGDFTPQPQPPTGIIRNGFNALGEYDKPAEGGNNDGRIDSTDSIFSSLSLWQDTNHNGISERSELHTLPERGLASIDLKYKESKRTDEYGNQFRYRAKVKDVHGSQVDRWAWDVFLVAGH